MAEQLNRRGLVRTGLGITAGVAAVAAVPPGRNALAKGAAPAMALGAVPATAQGAVPAMVQGAVPATPPIANPAAKQASYAMKPLPFDPQRIRGMSERILVSHYENNYGGAVKRLNSIADQLATMDFETTPGFVLNGLKREELVATNSMILHELFFAGLGDESQPGTALNDAIARDFGSPERWRSEFMAMGRAQGGGSGWVLLTWNARDRKLVNAWAADHTTTLAGGTPILALDMYEHAYQMDFGAKAGGYVDAFMGTIRWANPERLFEQLNKT